MTPAHDPPVQYSDHAWRALWAALNERRKSLGMSWRTFYATSEVSRGSVAPMQHGASIQSEHKLVNLSRAARWTPDSARRVLEGGEPIPEEAAKPASAVVGTDEKLDELLEVVRSLETHVLLIAATVLPRDQSDPTPASGSERQSPSKR